MSKTIIDVKSFEFKWSRITRNCCNRNVNNHLRPISLTSIVSKLAEDFLFENFIKPVWYDSQVMYICVNKHVAQLQQPH